MLVELETELSNRELDKAVVIGLKAMPLHQDIEESKRKANMSLKIAPNFVSHVLEVTDIGEHRKNGFDDHAHVPYTWLTEAQVGGMPVLFSEAGVREDDHLVSELVNQMLKGCAIIDIRGVTLPVDNAPQVIQHEAELAADNPALIRLAFLADLPCTAPLPSWVQQFNAITVNDADQRR